MAFVHVQVTRPSQPARRGRAARPDQPLFRLEQLEARETPAVSLLDVNSSILGAGNGDAEVLAVTPNGRFAIFSSTSNDIISQQNDIPGTKDLFWIDFLTGSRKLVTGAGSGTTTDQITGNLVYNYTNTTTAFSRAFPGVEAFGQAVISDDGQFVAFTSKVDAGLLDLAYATKSQNATSNKTLPGDRASTTYDVFRWRASSGQVQLASRTYDNKTDPTQAFGFRSQATDPAISADGTVVAFVSQRDAKYVYEFDGNAKRSDDPVIDTPDSSNDLFFTDFTRIEAGQKQTTTVVSKVQNQYPNTFRTSADDFFWQEEWATFGFLAQYKPANAAYFGYVPIFDFFDLATVPERVGYTPVSVHVDPLGRYLSGDGKNATFASDINSQWVLAPDFNLFSATPPLNNQRQDIYLYRIDNVDKDTSPNARCVTVTDSEPNIPVTLSLAGGNARNSILARDNSDRVLFTASVGSNQEGKTLVEGYVGPVNDFQAQLPDFPDTNLYLREHPIGTIAGNKAILVNATDASSTTPGNIARSPTADPRIAQSALPSDPTDTNVANPQVDPRSYQITQDGQFVVFTTPSRNMLTAARGVPADKNGDALDVFRRDINQTFQNINTGNGFKANTGALVAVSVSAAGTATGNADSYNPAISPDGRFVAFESLASNIVATGIDVNKVSDVYVRDFQASKDTKGNFVARNGLVSATPDGSSAGDAASFRPVVGFGPAGGRVLFTSKAGNLTPELAVVTGTQHAYAADLPITTAGGGAGSTDVGAVSGGFQAAASLVRFTGNGNIALGDKFTPFPGFTGEIAVAAADVNGDGVPDLIAGGGEGGGPRVTVIDGATGSRTLTRTDPATGAKISYVIDFFAYESSFRGGVNVAAGFFPNPDGSVDAFADLVIGTGNGGGSRVRVISGKDGKTSLADFFAYEASFRGGVRVAAGDVTGDGISDIITGAGFGGGPRVSVFDGKRIPLPTRVVDIFAFEPTLRNGVYVGAGDITGDGSAEVVVGGGPGGGPRVTAFDGKSLLGGTSGPVPVVNMFVFPEESRNGVRVAVRDIDGNGTGDLLVGQGSGEQSRVRTFLVADPDAKQTPILVDDVILYGDFGSLNGAWVG